MAEALVILSGLIAGAIAWFPCGVGLAAHRYKLGAAVVNSTNKWILLGIRRPDSFPFLGRVAFVLAMLIWALIFFSAFVVPVKVARVLGVFEASPSIGYALCAYFGMAVVAFVLGPSIWRKLAFSS